jgi:23S rRNA pseudouridine1911/1915/1917 synthase
MSSGIFIANSSGRLDKLLSLHIGVSRNQVEKLIKDSLVVVDGKVVTKASFKLAPESKVEYSFKEAPKQEHREIDIDIEILYEDDDVLVINKPTSLVVHPAPSVKEPTLVDWLRKKEIRLSTISGEERNGIVHRLDKDTSGALLVAKSNFAHEALSKQLQDRSMGRYYLSVINYPLKESVVVNRPIARNPKNRLKMAIVDGGKEAKTAFAKMHAKDDLELIAAKLYSGRTHQIRVHLGVLNRYILGDSVYAPKSVKHNHRIFLHAYLLYFIHPRTKELTEVKAPLFKDMREYIDKKFCEGVDNESFKIDNIKEYFKDIDTSFTTV